MSAIEERLSAFAMVPAGAPASGRPSGTHSYPIHNPLCAFVCTSGSSASPLVIVTKRLKNLFSFAS